MRRIRGYVVSTVVTGLLIVVPLYLSLLLLLQAMRSVDGLVRPFAMLLPKNLPAVDVLALLLVLIVCFFVGVLVRTAAGKSMRERLERSLFERFPGYGLF